MSTTAIDAGRRDQFKWPILASCTAALILSFLAMPDYAESADAWGYGLRVTARIAFFFLMLAYIARPLKQLSGAGGVLLKNRRYLGLSVALAHTVHFVCVYIVVTRYDIPLDPVVLIGGGGAFIAMWLMALTSNDKSIRLLGRNWKRLHLFGLHYLWVIFMFTFAGRLGGEDALLYWVIILLGLAGWALRVWAFVARRRA